MKINTLLFLFLILRLFTSAFIELGNDEVYYVLYAQYPGWAHFDHPPMVGWLIQLTTFDLYFKSEWLIRLGPVLLGTLNAGIIYRLARKQFSERAGFYAALLYCCNIYTAIISGVFILPDSPQLTGWLLALVFLDRLTNDDRDDLKTWLLLALSILFTLLCKLHGVFIWAGIGLYALVYKREWLSNYKIYLAFFISLIGLLPTLLWNMEHDWMMFSFHQQRVGSEGRVNFTFFTRFILGQLLYQNPFVLVSIGIGTVALYKSGTTQLRLAWCLFLPLFLLPLYNALFKETLPHWTGPAYLSLLPLGGYGLMHLKDRGRSILTGLTAGLPLILLIAGPILINTGFILNNTGKSTSLKTETGKGDFSMDLYGWKAVQPAFGEYCRQHHEIKTVVEAKWFPAAHIDFYLAPANHLTVLGMGKNDQIHEYRFINALRRPLKVHEDAMYITTSNFFEPVPKNISDQFEKLEKPDFIPVTRSGKVVKYLVVYKLRDFRR